MVGLSFAILAYPFQLNNMICYDCIQVAGKMRLVFVRHTHIDLKHLAARCANKMMMMLISWMPADKKHGLPVFSVHPVNKFALHQPVQGTVDGWKSHITIKSFLQLVLDLLG
jgi:hypothetical protein